MFGYAGKILRVDLTAEKTSVEELSAYDAKKYLGGRGLAAKILFKELKKDIDPLGPENKLIIASGPLTGTGVPGTTRFGVYAKSPLTGIWGESSAAGWFSPEIKAAGFDLIIFEGASSRPVYIWIHDGEVEIRDASHLWGKFTLDAEKVIREELQEPDAQMITIGPAGEKLVRMANVLHKGHRAAGRTGMGAVMGSKKLKAVAVRGTRKIKFADEDKLKLLIKNILSRFRDLKDPQNLGRYGTARLSPILNEAGLLPTKNFQDGVFEGAEKISGEEMARTILNKRLFCPGCPIGCMRVVEVKTGPFSPVTPDYGGPEYETVAALGSNCFNDNLESIAKANMICNMYGIDTISTGVAISFAMECYEKGILTLEDTDGIELTWGNAKAIVLMAEKIGKREGLGNLLAEGVKRAAEKIGCKAEEFAMHVKGLEIPMHEPRGKKGIGLSYATSNRGACHLQSLHDPYFEQPNAAPEAGITEKVNHYSTSRTKVEYVIRSENTWGTLSDSLIICKFTFMYWPFVKLSDMPEIIKAVTGWDISVKDLMVTGERIFNLCRAFNVREGITRKDDVLPRKFEELPITGGAAKGQTLSRIVLSKMLDDYYDIRGWNKETGIPTRNKLQELGLKFVADELEETLPNYFKEGL
jgi:aldehyde:ferredoxin oxidoreductase